MVYMAMSGGVDSSVAAALLKKQGYDVTGVFMRPWQPSLRAYELTSLQAGCLWQKDREDAMRVAAKIGIPLLTWDFSKEYKREVTDYMIREYRSGRTPNPDVMCNRRIKFGVFLDKALKAGADYIATGHYVRLMRKSQNTKPKSQTNSKFKNKFENLNIENSLKIENCKLKIAKDKNKDQSYFLWTLTQKQLKYCLFPVGDYTKPEIRKMAKKFGLSTAGKKDSQGVCFIGPLDMKNFLQKYIKPKKGKIFDMDKNFLGEHDGVYYYTIGQRHGLDIKDGKGPYYVVDKDIKKNIIYVSNQLPTKPTLRSAPRPFGVGANHQRQEVAITDVSWIGEQPKLPARIEVKIRYRSESIPAVINLRNSAYRLISLPAYQLKSVTPGQSAVFYKGKEMLGGGIIK